MKSDNYVVGLDIGISSVGWAVIDDKSDNLVDFGVRRFNEAMPASDARLNRSARRSRRRKSWRKNQLKDAFTDFGILNKEDIDMKGFLSYTATHKSNTLDKKIKELKEPTIYHTRQKGLSKKLTDRELFLSLYNICKTRGHFLVEDVDFLDGDDIKESDLVNEIFKIIDKYINFDYKKEDQFTKDILLLIINEKISSNEIKTKLKIGFTLENEDKSDENKKLESILKIISGYKSNLSLLNENYKNCNITSLKNDPMDDYCEKIINIYDNIQTKKIIKNYNYLCDKHVDILEKLKKYGNFTEKELSKDNELNQFFKQNIAKMSDGDIKKKEFKEKYSSLKVIKNTENNYPNGLYLKEARDILRKQQSYNKKITNDFINVCLEVISARIPYYMGPLSKDAKNSWITRKDAKVKYSYNYALKEGLFNEEKSIKDWKLNMISKCTYLPDEYALPKQSMFIELFTILNDLNIYTVVDKDSNRIKLSKNQKVNLIDSLFLKEENTIKFSQVKEVLGVEEFGSISKNTTKFNKQFSMYFKIIDILPKLKIKSIEEEFATGFKKMSKIEKIIIDLVLYDDYINKKETFIKQHKIKEEDAEKLAKLNSKDFSSLSYKFIYETPVDKKGNFIIEKLLMENLEQMSIISNATNSKGNKINFSSNKYLSKLNESNLLDINLLIEDGKPFVPMSRVVIRSLNECFKVYNQIVKEFGQPKKLVIETARELGDFSLEKKVPAKHFQEMKKLHEHLIKENKANKIDSDLESWEQTEKYLLKNKKKIELYIRQDGKDMLTGANINISKLIDYDIDHILPRGCGDNSMNNSMLILRSINNQKSNRVPLEFLRDTSNSYSEQEFKDRVNSLFNRKLISEKKVDLLLLENTDDALGFVSRNLVDTRYIIKEFSSILEAYYKFNEINTNIVSLQGTYNAVFRTALNIRKNRDHGDQHHAHDAAIIVIVDKTLESSFPNYASGNVINAARYKKQVQDLYKEDSKNKKNKYTNKNMSQIRTMFMYAYSDINILNQIKEKTPRLSWKVEKKTTGELFNATLYKPNEPTKKEIVSLAKDIGLDIKCDNLKENIIKEIGEEEYNKQIIKYSKAPLDILGVNNDKRSFSTIYSVAVDIYKINIGIEKGKNKEPDKLKKKFFAVHIPKVIVNNGIIDEKKYIDLIKYHYKYNELIDDDGKLITKAFKFRLFKNDMFYDTSRQEISIFNIGSIVDNRIEIKRPNIYSFNDLDKQKEMVSSLLEKSKNIYWSKRDTELNLGLILNYLKEQGYKLLDLEELIITNFALKEKGKKEINKYEFIDYLSKAILDAQYSLNSTKIYERIRPTIGNVKKSLKYNEDTEYIKLNIKPTGIKFNKDENSKIFITGNYKKIKKEEFSFTIK